MSEAPSDPPGFPHRPSSAGSPDTGVEPVRNVGGMAAIAHLSGERPPRLTAGRLLAGGLSLALLIVLLAVGLPWAAGASWSRIGATLGALPGWALPAMVLLGAAVLGLEALTVRAALPGARYGRALQAHAAATALGLAVPGGSTVGLGVMAWLLRRAGLALGAVITGIMAASLVETALTSVLVPMVGLGAYALGALWGPTLPSTVSSLPGGLWAAALALAGSVIALALTAMVLRRAVLAAFLRHLAPGVSPEMAATVLAQRDSLVALLRRRPAALLLPTLAARVLQWAALVLAIQAVGAEVPLLLTVAVFALGRVLSLVPLTPGGAGITEAVGAAVLVALGVAPAEAAAAMLLLLVTMLLVPLVSGGIAATTAVGTAPAPHPAA